MSSGAFADLRAFANLEEIGPWEAVQIADRVWYFSQASGCMRREKLCIKLDCAQLESCKRFLSCAKLRNGLVYDSLSTDVIGRFK